MLDRYHRMGWGSVTGVPCGDGLEKGDWEGGVMSSEWG